MNTDQNSASQQTVSLGQNAVSKYTVSFGWSLALSSVFNALLVIAKEKSPAIQAGMKKLTGHHWITHVVIVLILFFLFGWIFANLKSNQRTERTVNGLIKTLVGAVCAAGLMIVGFYLIGD